MTAELCGYKQRSEHKCGFFIWSIDCQRKRSSR